MDLEALVDRAVKGDRTALDALVRALRDDVYGLAMRMLWHPADAADATQEILVLIITRLSTFRGESSFRTWAFRVASNALLRAKSRRLPVLEPVEDAEPERPVRTPEEQLLEKETRFQCSLGMLQLLDAEHRLAYVVGEVMGLSSEEAAEVTGAEPATFRKRLSRAREKMRGVLQGHCGVVNERAACRCNRRMHRLDGRERLFTTQATRASASLVRKAEQLAAHDPSTDLYRQLPELAAPEALGLALRSLLTLD